MIWTALIHYNAGVRAGPSTQDLVLRQGLPDLYHDLIQTTNTFDELMNDGWAHRIDTPDCILHGHVADTLYFVL